MAAKQRTIELILSGKMDRSLPGALGKVQAHLSRYQKMTRLANTAQSQMRASASAVAGGVLRGAAGYAAAYVGVTQLAGGIRDSIKAYGEQSKMEARLAQLMGNVKGTTKEQIDGIKQYAAQLQTVTTIGDEVNIMGASQLATFQLQAKSIKKLMPALDDLAVGQYGINVSQEQMQQAANMLGKAVTGNVGALTRVGIKMSETQKRIIKTGDESQRTATLMEVIKQNYGGVAEALADTPEGRIQQMANAWGDVQEKIGFALAPVVMKVLGSISSRLPQIEKFLTKIAEGGGNLLTSLLPVVTKGLMPIVNFITQKLWPLLQGIGRDILGIFQEVWPVIQPHIEKVNSAISNLFSNLVPTIRSLWDLVKPVLKWLLKDVLPQILSLFEGIINKVTALIEYLKRAVDGINAFRDAMNARAEAKKSSKRTAEYEKWAQDYMANHKGEIRAQMERRSADAKLNISARAAGGPVASGQPYLVGERGPELFIPKHSGGIVPNNQMALAGLGTVNVNVTINGSASASDVRNGIATGVKDFERMLDRVMRERGRRSFA